MRFEGEKTIMIITSIILAEIIDLNQGLIQRTHGRFKKKKVIKKEKKNWTEKKGGDFLGWEYQLSFVHDHQAVWARKPKQTIKKKPSGCALVSTFKERVTKGRGDESMKETKKKERKYKIADQSKKQQTKHARVLPATRLKNKQMMMGWGIDLDTEEVRPLCTSKCWNQEGWVQ